MSRTAKRLILNFGGASAPSATPVLTVNFATDDAAPLTSPYAGELGSLTIVETDGTFAVSGGKLTYTAQTTAAWGDQRFYGAGVARQAGRALTTTFRYSTAGQAVYFCAFAQSNNPGFGSAAGIDNSIAKASGTTINYAAGAALIAGHTFESLSSNTSYQVAVVLRSAGAFYFSKLSGTWELMWVDAAGTTATVYPMFGNFDSAGSLDYFRLGDLPAPFTTDNGIATVNAASPSGSYTATADQLIELTLTAPGTITTEAGFRFRVVDSNNYWRAYFNTSGAFRVDSVETGVATNRINVAGVITAGATRTIRVISDGTAQDAFSLATATWTKRGSQLTNDIHTTATGIETDIGAGWTAANLRSYPRTSSTYNLLDNV
jgi:hypothetical protein